MNPDRDARIKTKQLSNLFIGSFFKKNDQFAARLSGASEKTREWIAHAIRDTWQKRNCTYCLFISRGRSLVAPHPRQLISMIVRVAEQFFAHAGALHEKADVELVGHAHAAMHLHAFLHRARCRRAGARLG